MEVICQRCGQQGYFSNENEAISKLWQKKDENNWLCHRCSPVEDYEKTKVDETDTEFDKANHHHDDGDTFFNKDICRGGSYEDGML